MTRKNTEKSVKIISIVNQKGGVGKSTTAISITSCLHKKGFKTLLIDLDGQSNLTFSLGINDSEFSFIDAISGGEKLENIIQKTEICDLIPSNTSLYNASEIITEIGKEYKLKELIEPIKNDYDYIIIDTPPTLGIITVNALTCSNNVIIPAEAAPFSLFGVEQLNQTITAVKQYCNPDLSITGIVMTMHTERAIISRDMLELMNNMAQKLNTKVFNTKIRKCLALTESQASQKDIMNYASKSNAAIDYMNLTEEILLS